MYIMPGNGTLREWKCATNFWQLPYIDAVSRVVRVRLYVLSARALLLLDTIVNINIIGTVNLIRKNYVRREIIKECINIFRLAQIDTSDLRIDRNSRINRGFLSIKATSELMK